MRCNRRPHRFDAEIRTHGSLLALLESNPNPPPPAIMNCTSQRSVRERAEDCADIGAKVLCKLFVNEGSGPDGQSERLTDSGVMCRGPGAVRCPADV